MNNFGKLFGSLIMMGIMFRVLLSLFNPILFLVFIALMFGSIGSIFKSAQSFTRKNEYRRNRKYSVQEYAQLNEYLKKWFKKDSSIQIGNGYELRLKNREYQSLDSLMVYESGRLMGSFMGFKSSHPDSYQHILQELMIRAKNSRNEDVIDVQVEKHEEKTTNSGRFVERIDDLNSNIQDTEIKNSLFRTRALLVQVLELEKKFPESKEKLRKLYEYYIPYLIDILEKFVKVQISKMNDDYDGSKNKLIKTISMVNEAMENIISNLNDEDFMELNADMSTLEAILKKDGLTKEGTLGKNHEE